MSTSFGKLNVSHNSSLSMLTPGPSRAHDVAVLSDTHFWSMSFLPLYRPLSTAVLRWAHESQLIMLCPIHRFRRAGLCQHLPTIMVLINLLSCRREECLARPAHCLLVTASRIPLINYGPWVQHGRLHRRTVSVVRPRSSLTLACLSGGSKILCMHLFSRSIRAV